MGLPNRSHGIFVHKSMRIVQLILLIALPVFVCAQGNLDVVVLLNKPKMGGMLRVMLYSSAKDYKADQPIRTRTLEVEGTTASCAFDSLAPGTYAVQAYQDVNNNGMIDKSRIGWPREPYGFSNDAPVNAGPPSFKLAAIEVKEGDQTERIRLR